MQTFLDSLQRAIDNAPSPAVAAELQAILTRAVAK